MKFIEEHAAVVIDEDADHEQGEEEDAPEAMGPPGVAGTSDGMGEIEEVEEVLGDDGVSD